MAGGFQQQVNNQPAPGVPGNRASQNPIFSYDAGPGGLVAGSSCFVGRFAWCTPPLDPNGAPTIANCFGGGAPDGFVMHNHQALMTAFLGSASMQIPPGFAMALQIAGDFWVQNDGPTEAQYGHKAFAYVNNGKVAFAPAGTVFGGASALASDIAAATFSVTGSIAGNTMTVTAVGSGTVVNGASVSGTSIPTNPAPKVVQQLTPLRAGEATGGIGRYLLDVGEITAASETISGTYGLLTLGTTTGTFGVGDVLTGSGVVAGTRTTQLLTGAGGTASTFAVDKNTVVASTTITASLAVETKFIARGTGLPGDPVKMSSTTNAGG